MMETVKLKTRESLQSALSPLSQKTLLLGCSGGMDSMLLLRILTDLREELGFSLFVLTVDHGLRGEEAREDARLVREVCETYGVPCRIETVDVAHFAERSERSIEDAARILRYRALSAEMKRVGADALICAHHRRDQAETMLYRMIRGTGLKGLSGMRLTAPVPEGEEGQILVRPLLFVDKEAIEKAAVEGQVSWRNDATNEEIAFARNRIRKTILPLFSEENAKAEQHLSELAEEVALVNDYLNTQAVLAMAGEEKGTVSEKTLNGAHPALQPVMIRLLLSENGGLTNVTREHIGDVLGLLSRRVGARIDLPGNRLAERSYEGIRLVEKKKEAETADETEFLPLTELIEEGKTRTIRIGNRVFSVRAEISDLEKIKKVPKFACEAYTNVFDYDKISRIIGFRKRRTGDRMIVTRDGKTASVKKILIDKKVPAKMRDAIPVLAAESEVYWIPGVRRGETAYLSETTKQVCTIVILPETGEETENKENGR